MQEEVIHNEYNIINSFNKVLTKTFFRMFLGLLCTAIVAFISYKAELYLEVPYTLLAILEVVVVLIFSLLFKKLSPTVVTFLFYIYAIINGLTMAVIFAVFEIETIFYAFGMTSVLFASLAIVGNKTDKDMSKFGNILLVALVVGVVFSIVNIFLKSTMLDIALDWAILLIFCGITAYDVNKIKRLQNSYDVDEKKLYIYCAMDLYLDFINIFLRILSILGRRKN